MPKAKANDENANSWFSIKAQSNNNAVIKLYDEIGGWGVTARSFAQELANLGDIKNIELRIDSPGGDVFEGITIYNLLKGLDAYVTVYIDGLAASMGSVIAMAGDKIIMPSTAFMMIHKPWGGQVGDADDLRAYADLLDKVETTLSETYTKKTGLGAEEIAALLKEETWFSGAEAVEAGFADELSNQSQTTHYANSKRMENYNMPDKLKALMKPKASTTQQPTVPNAVATEADILARVQAAEVTRRAGISNIFANFGGKHKDIENECLLDMSCSVDAAKDKVLAHLGKGTVPATPQDQSHFHAGNGNIVGDSVASAILSRAGHQARDADNIYNNYNLRELARASLADRGIACSTQAPLAMIGMAFTHTSSDFGQILIDVAHKSLLKGWEDSAETFEMWTNKGSLSDFKTSNRVGLDELGSLRKVKEGAEYKYITTSDRAEQIALATYGEIFAITRQAIINDDLSALTRIPTMMGRAAKATIGDLVYAILTSNPTMSDNKTLFHSEHGNTGTGSISDINALDKLRQLMRKQKSGKRNLNIRPEYILGPTALEAQANQTIRSASVKGSDANSGIVNPLQNFATYIAEPRLDDDSAVKFYMAAAQGQDTIEVAYLDGIDTPYIEQQEGFTVDGVSTKVRIDAGVAPLDYRGFVRSTGA